MNLTKATIRKQTTRALKESGIDGTIKSIEWVGRRSPKAFGGGFFRVAEVAILCNGRIVYKSASVDTSGCYQLC